MDPLVVLNFDMETELAGVNSRVPRRVYDKLQRQFFWIVPLLGGPNAIWLTDTEFSLDSDSQRVCQNFGWQVRRHSLTDYVKNQQTKQSKASEKRTPKATEHQGTGSRRTASVITGTSKTDLRQPNTPGSRQSLLPWGVTPRFTHSSLADVACVKKVHSKLFAHELAVEFGVAVDDAAVVNSVDEFHEVMEKLPAETHWILKANLSSAGRNSCLGFERILVGEKLTWAQRQLAYGPLIFQSYLQRQSDFSVIGELTQSGDFRKLAFTESLVSGRTYQASLVQDYASHWDTFESQRQHIDNCFHATAVRLRDCGYFGPFGIDGLIDENGRCYPLVEINARYTMGRVAFELKRHFGNRDFALLKKQSRSKSQVVNDDLQNNAQNSGNECEFATWLGPEHCFLADSSRQKLYQQLRNLS